jgi:hypothetical protein
MHKIMSWPNLFLFFCALVFLYHFFAPDHQAREGDLCGPDYHWRYINTNAAGPDLSCEAD